MKLFDNIENLFFIGIGGIGMSALARYFVQNGKTVAGYDKTQTQMTKKLASEGIQLQFEDKLDSIPEAFTNKQNTLVVYTPAVSSENRVFQYFQDEGFSVKKRAEVLGMITAGMPTLAVAGTHGKTTTTAILAHILKQSGVKLTAFLGGICENYHSNYIGDGNEVAVVEADEFDRSFLQLTPTWAAITSMDADHLDIYGEEKSLRDSFHAFASKVEPKNLIYSKNLPLDGKSIAINESADYEILDIEVENGSYRFSFKTNEKLYKNIRFSLPGKHNLMNAGMALALGLKFGVDAQKMIAGLESFKGVERRFTYHLKTDRAILIEDYAHHPKEIKAVYQAVREMHPSKKAMVVFQPHLFSRTRDFADDFAESLSTFDEVVLLEIYPAREKAIPGIDSKFLLDKIQNKHKKLIDREVLSTVVKDTTAEVIILMGAGDIGDEAASIKIALTGEN